MSEKPITIDDAIALHQAAFLKLATDVALKMGDDCSAVEDVAGLRSSMEYHFNQCFAAKAVLSELQWTLDQRETTGEVKTE